MKTGPVFGCYMSGAVVAAAAANGAAIHTAIIHPIVLLSVVDHYTREAVQTQRRVIGVLLGAVKDGVVDVTNCYAGACHCALAHTSGCFSPKKTVSMASRSTRSGWHESAPCGRLRGTPLSLRRAGVRVFAVVRVRPLTLLVRVAVPFEEDSRNSKIWFVDHNFHEKMFSMFRKVNGARRCVWLLGGCVGGA